MAVSDIPRVSGPFLGNGVQKMFPFSFAALQPQDVGVIYRHNGVTIPLTFGVHYTVNLNTDQKINPGGLVVLGTAPPLNSALTVVGSARFSSTFDLSPQGAFDPKVIVEANDRAIILAQELRAQLERCLRVADGDTSPGFLPPMPDRANRFLGFDANGQFVPLQGTGGDPGLRDDLASSIGASLIGTLGGITVEDALGASGPEINFLDYIPKSEWAAIEAGVSTYDCADALEEAINTNVRESSDPTTPWRRGGPKIIFPRGVYMFGRPIPINCRVTLMGEATGISTNTDNANVSTLRWFNNTSGLIFHSQATSGIPGDYLLHPTPPHGPGNAGASRISQLKIVGPGNTSGATSGIVQKCQLFVDNIEFDLWGFAGLFSHNSATTSDPNTRGNSNCSFYMTIRSIRNGHAGVYNQGPDANACTFILMNVASNARFGLVDRAFLGNTHIGHHSANNGTSGVGGNPVGSTSIVNYGGTIYYADYEATETQLVLTQPGTNDNIWRESGNASWGTPWVSGQPVGTYFVGACYLYESSNAGSLWISCYTESGQAPMIARGAAASKYAGKAIIIGGTGMRPARYGDGREYNGRIFKENAGISIRCLNVDSIAYPNLTRTQLGVDDGFINFDFVGENDIIRWKRSGKKILIDNRNLGSAQLMVMNGFDSAETWGHASSSTGGDNRVRFPRGISLGTSATNGRTIRQGTAFTSGETVAAGEIMFRTNGTAGGWGGIYVTVGGVIGSTAQTKNFAAIES